MSDIGLDLSERRNHRADNAKRRGRGCLIGAVVLAIVVVAGYFTISWGADKIAGALNGPPQDYSGQGTGKLVVQVHEGDTVADIARTLKAEGVIASVDGFLELANGDKAVMAVQPGFYQLREQMSAESALAGITDPANRLESNVTVPEGSRVGEIVSLITKSTDISKSDLTNVLDHPQRLDLPAEAGGNPEGYLFPATYTVQPGTSGESLLREMVAKTLAVEKDLNVSGRADALGITPEQALTVASIIEYEAKRDQDLPKVARVIYNRLDAKMPLQLDSTVAYVSQRKGDVFTTDAERSSGSAYNTYQHTGLPPGPIGSPGEKTIQAALKPAAGPWLYFVPINFETGKTLFTASYSQHLRNVARAKAYCQQSDIC